MKAIEKAVLLEQINQEISNLPHYDHSIKIIDITVNANGFIDHFLPNKFDEKSIKLADHYMSEIDHIFQGKYYKVY